MADSYTVYSVYEELLKQLYSDCASVVVFREKSLELLNSAHQDSSLTVDYFDMLTSLRQEIIHEYSWINGR